MSKKNNRKIKDGIHKHDIEREREAARRKEQKLMRTKESGVKKPKAKKARAIKLRKNRVVMGIKIKDSSSRKRARELLQAQQAVKSMELSDDEWEEMPAEELEAMAAEERPVAKKRPPKPKPPKIGKSKR